MIAIVIIFGIMASFVTLYVFGQVIVYLLKYKLNKIGINIVYYLQYRWEAHKLESAYHIRIIRAKDRKSKELHPVEEVEQEHLANTVEPVLISLDREVLCWSVYYSENKNQYGTELDKLG